MYSFSKVIASNKTANEAIKEEAASETALKKEAEEIYQKKQAEDELKNQAEAEENAIKQHAIDITQRHMLAHQYEQMMIDDDAKEGINGAFSNFQVIADAKAEQDYAVNVYKGSGNMDNLFDSMKKDAQKQKLEELQIQNA